jgi:hypothetical protein
MKPLTVIYWSRAFLGLVIGLLCGVYIFFSASTELASFYTLLTGLSFALLFYIATYYLLELRFFARVDTPSKIVRQGIGIYFFAWLVSWTLMVTLMAPSVSIGISYENGGLALGREFKVVAWDTSGSLVRTKNTTTASLLLSLLPQGDYVLELENVPEGYTASNQSLKLRWLQNQKLNFTLVSVPD